MAWDRTCTLASPQSTRSPSIQTFPTGVMGIDSLLHMMRTGRPRGARRGRRQDIGSAARTAGGSGQVVGSPQDPEVGLDGPPQRAESSLRPGPELGPNAAPNLVGDPPRPGMHAGFYVVEELSDGGV